MLQKYNTKNSKDELLTKTTLGSTLIYIFLVNKSNTSDTNSSIHVHKFCIRKRT